MTPLPGALGGSELIGWRLDRAHHAPSWDSGEGAFLLGGRWNSVGARAVYAALDPAAAILEVAVHKGFDVLDTQPHVLTQFRIDATADIHVIEGDALPNPNWLAPGIPSAGQQGYGDGLLADNDFLLLPSVVSRHSWNLVFDPVRAKGRYQLIAQEPFALDPRLHPPTKPK